MRVLLSLFVCLFSFNFLYGQGTNVSGYVSGTWGVGGEPYYVVGQCTVATGTSLTIQPGVRVIFRVDSSLAVQGTLDAQGTVSDSILFTIDPAYTSEFAGIRFLDPASGGTISYARVEGGFAQGSSPEYSGGGIYIQNSSPTISNSVVKNCRAVGFGGGIALFGGNATVEYCTVYNDSARYAGGIHLNANAIVRKNRVFDNESANYGGGLASVGTNGGLIIENNLIYNNSSTRGGGISLTSGVTSELWNNLVYNNTATIEGGGVFISGATTDATITNTVLWNNSTTGNGSQISVNDGILSIDYSDIMGGTGGTYFNPGVGTLNYLTNNIASNPNFNDTPNADFHVEATSPIVDAGMNTGAPSDDFDDISRPFDGNRDLTATVDIGPYEYVNTPPVITSSPVLSVDEDQPYTYQVVVDDPDAGEDILYEITTSHTFLGIDADTGEITGTPDNDDVDTHNVTVRATDRNGEYDEQTYSLEVVQVNDAPVVSNIPDQGINEDETFIPISLDDYVSDDDHLLTQISWTASATTNFDVTITDRVATITVLDPEWGGSETVTFTAEDPDGATGSDDAIFTVTAINDAPIVTDIPDQGINEDETFTSISLDAYVSDDDHSDAQISWTASATTNFDVTIIDRVATITVLDPEWGGNETVTFTAEDPDGATDSDDATFTVTAINDAPIVTDIPDQGINEDETFTSITLDDYVSDDDHSDAQISWTASATTNFDVTITDRVATITVLDPEWGGNETVTFTAEDPDGATDSDDATFTVTATNDAPVVGNIPDQEITEEDTFTSISLDDYVSDPDNADTEISWTTSATTNITVTITDRVAAITVNDPEWNDSESVTFTAEDPNGLTDSVDVTFTVTPVNDPPVVSDIPDQTIPEDSSFTSITLDNYVSDPDNADTEISWTASATNNISVTITDRIASITINDPEWGGSETVTFTAEDPDGLTDSDDALFAVTAVNDPPQILPFQELTFNEDDSLVTAIALLLYEYVDDPDHPDSLLRITFKDGQNVIAYVDSPNVVMKAPANWYGSDTLEVKVSDGELSDSVKVAVMVKSINDIPLFVDLPDTVSFDNDSDTTLTMRQYAMDEDPNDNLSWIIETSNTALNVEFDNVTTELTLSAPGYIGVVTVKCTITDDSSASVTDSFFVNVKLPTAIEDMTKIIPLAYKLDQNYPNPFNPLTHIQFGMQKAGDVKIEVYNVLGQKVMTLWDGYKDAGYHIVKFNAGDLSSGLYFYRMETKEFTSIRKMILMK